MVLAGTSGMRHALPFLRHPERIGRVVECVAHPIHNLESCTNGVETVRVSITRRPRWVRICSRCYQLQLTITTSTWQRSGERRLSHASRSSRLSSRPGPVPSESLNLIERVRWILVAIKSIPPDGTQIRTFCLPGSDATPHEQNGS